MDRPPAPVALEADDPTETWAAPDVRSAKALFVPSLKGDIVPSLHGHDPRREGHMAIHIRRREFIVTLGSAAAWPLRARAQQPAMPVIGFLDSKSPEDSAPLVAEFRRGLNESTFFEGQNVVIEFRWAQNKYDQLPVLATDLVRRRVDVIAATGGPAALAAKAASTTIPIVFRLAADPIAAGLVAGLSHPGGNVTGVTSLNLEVGSKRLELLHELVPAATIMAALVNPTNPSNAEILSRDLQATARLLGLQLHLLHADSDADIDSVFATLTELRAGGLVIGTDAFFTNREKNLAALALRYRIPTIYQSHEFVAAGGLMSYGGSFADSYRLAGIYTGRILKGDKPADLPVQQSTKVELIINMKTAKALGLTFPLTLLGRADEVVE
jgi:putative ABC transport system substrate-binding protein